MRKATLLVILLLIASFPSPATADEPIRQRTNMTEFTWMGSATTVQVSGEWDDWQVRTDLEENNGSWGA